MQIPPKGVLIGALLLLAIAGFWLFDLGQYLTLAFVKSQQQVMVEFYRDYPWQTALGFFALYILVTATSFPGAALMTLIAGAIFGVLWGSVIVSFASTIGATLAFLIARWLLKGYVQRRFGQRLAAINRGVEREGAFYLFALRLIPSVPFFVINLAMALTPIRTVTFYGVSQLGMLPATIVYVNAGTQLAELESLSDILSLDLILSFVAIALLPFLTRWLLRLIKAAGKALNARRRASALLAPYSKPAQFDRNLVVIGAGSAGLVSAYIAAAVKAKVTLIEKHKMGGDCLNTGCVPSKALIRTSRVLQLIKRAPEFGLSAGQVAVDFPAVMARIRRVIAAIEPHDSPERYRGLGVEVIQGEATITSPYEVAVNGQRLTTRRIIVATGASPTLPPIPGLKEMQWLTSDTVWSLESLPERLLVLGGGPIGCELSQAFARLGSRVTQLEMAPRLLIREDEEISERIMARFRAEGVDVRVRHKAVAFERDHQGEQRVVAEGPGGERVEIPFDAVLVALGRRPNTSGFGLEGLNMPLNDNGTIATNDYLQTAYPTIYAVGDVAGPYQFTHVGAHQAWYGAVNALFGGVKKFKVDYSTIPWATFTDPEVARVGLNESDAKAQGIPYEVVSYDLEELDRAIAEGEAHGVVKVLTVPGKDKILGATIVGENAAEIIAEYITAMRHGLGMNKILSTIHIYPTLAEANKYAAGRWKQAHAPERILAWLARYHRWLRGGPLLAKGGVERKEEGSANA